MPLLEVVDDFQVQEMFLADLTDEPGEVPVAVACFRNCVIVDALPYSAFFESGSVVDHFPVKP